MRKRYLAGFLVMAAGLFAAAQAMAGAPDGRIYFTGAVLVPTCNTMPLENGRRANQATTPWQVCAQAKTGQVLTSPVRFRSSEQTLDWNVARHFKSVAWASAHDLIAPHAGLRTVTHTYL